MSKKNGLPKGLLIDTKLKKAKTRVMDRVVESMKHRNILRFKYYIAALEILFKSPHSLWSESRKDFFIEDPDNGGNEIIWELVDSFE